jgi:hypothetical protein
MLNPLYDSQMIYALLLILLGDAVFVPWNASGQTAAVSREACDPALAALFTPLRSQLGRYEVCTSERPLSGDAETLEPLDAFGTSGSYDRAKLARLYGGLRVRVTRSQTIADGQFVAITKVSPYPDASLTRLDPGTMEIRWILDGKSIEGRVRQHDETARNH